MAEKEINKIKGSAVQFKNNNLSVPDNLILPFIEGDGTGPDIWRAAVRAFDAAVKKAYGGQKQVVWKRVLAGEEAFQKTGNWLPEETVQIFREYRVGIKGPLTTPVGGGIRSLNVALRQILDLYVCLRPVRYFSGVPSPVKHPELTDMVVFRENTEDIYTGIEFQNGSEPAQKFKKLFADAFPELYKKIRFPDSSGLGLKPISKEGSERLTRAAIRYAIDNRRKNVTIVHKGNIMKFTEGAFRDWGYTLAKKEFNAHEIDAGPWLKIMTPDRREITIKDVIADNFLQQILTRPGEYDVLATTNLNGDYISDALAACVGGIGIAPGGNINYETGFALFEATHGTAPKYANQDRVNPGSLILSGEMMFRYLGWTAAADLLIEGMNRTIASKKVTYDFARLMEGAQEVKTSQFADELIKNIS